MGKSIYTFWTFINEHPIVIPQVQRDYAYGRKDDKAESVSTNILNSIHEALVPDNLAESGVSPLTMDFVYGNVKNVGLNPLDGQQRLTTLFLLHLYATIMEEKEEERETLKRFCYETRQSANNFCISLIDDFKYDTDFSKKKLSQQITDSPKFLPSYSADPTIESMLVILDKISDMFSDINNLWDKLTKEERVIFYFLPLHKFGLSDDLYIKMNSRGKGLTTYELFKSDFIDYLENNYSDYKEPFANKLDGTWTDTLWKYADQDATGNKNVRCVDDGFINLFSNISILLYHLRTDKNFEDLGKKTSKYLALPCNRKFTTKKEIELVFDIMDTVNNVLSSNLKKKYWDDIFYLDGNVLSEDSERIRLFWQQKENIFVLSFRDILTSHQLLLFYALYLGIKHNVEIGILKRRLRHIRNLIVNSDNELRGSKLHGMLEETGSLITKGKLPTNDFFNSTQAAEEIEKEYLDEWPSLWKFENHSILRGGLELFLKTGTTDQLRKFASLWGENYKSDSEKLRQALLVAGDGRTDYMQYQANMETKTLKKRFFPCNPDEWSKFFKLNQIRKNQEAIIECLKVLPQTTEELPDYINAGLKTLNKKSWKYYFVKYPGNNNTNKQDSQGQYQWNDMANKPLEVIMLNSSYEGKKYKEWNPLNLTLKYAFPEGECKVEPHGCSHVQLNYANSSVNATQEGWQVYTFEPDYLLEGLSELKKDSSDELKYSVSDISARDDKGQAMRLVKVPDGIDYNEFGMGLIKDIEAIYNAEHKAPTTTPYVK